MGGGGRKGGGGGGDFIPADIIISNNGVKETLDLAGRHNFPDDYVAMIDKMRLSFGAASVKYALDAEVVKLPLSCYAPDFNDPEMVERQGPLFVPGAPVVGPSSVPPGCQLIQAGSLGPPGLEEPEQADMICDMVLDRVENTMQDLYPDIEKHVVWKVRTNTQYVANISGRKTGEVIGLAQNRYQCGRNRPSNVSPIENLYLVGADAAGRGVGTEMAADSALNLLKTLSGKELRK